MTRSKNLFNPILGGTQIKDKLLMEQITTELWNRFSGGLRRFILKKVNDEALADDLLQETFIRIHSKIDNLRDEEKVQSWVFQIARNIINDHYRRNNPISVEEVPEVIDTELESDEVMTQTIRDMVLFMKDLPEQDCQALCLVELAGVSIKDYAEQAGISYSAAKSRVARARYKLSDLLMNCCHYEFDKYGTVIGYHPIHCCCCNVNK